MKHSYKIESGIPVPSTQERARFLPIHQMEVGDSVVVQLPEGHKVVASMRTTARKLGRKVVSRTIEGGAMRIWRTA